MTQKLLNSKFPVKYKGTIPIGTDLEKHHSFWAEACISRRKSFREDEDARKTACIIFIFDLLTLQFCPRSSSADPSVRRSCRPGRDCLPGFRRILSFSLSRWGNCSDPAGARKLSRWPIGTFHWARSLKSSFRSWKGLPFRKISRGHRFALPGTEITVRVFAFLWYTQKARWNFLFHASKN